LTAELPAQSGGDSAEIGNAPAEDEPAEKEEKEETSGFVKAIKGIFTVFLVLLVLMLQLLLFDLHTSLRLQGLVL
ncbi:MAG: hypothetical protein J6V35_07010, partial [Bacteroidales bacterium]|nr:hypothetical protein [Bacteroidales bacterium]